MYFCKELNCEEKSDDPRVIISHAYKDHGQMLAFCPKEECKGKLFTTALRKHHAFYHAPGDTSCDFCVPIDSIQSHISLFNHIKFNHRLETGHVYGYNLPADLNSPEPLDYWLKFFCASPLPPTLKIIKHEEKFAFMYDETFERPFGGVEILTPRNAGDTRGAPRAVNYAVNLELPIGQVTADHIRHLGFDASHIVPAMDWKEFEDDMNATFVNANIVGLFGNFNNGLWKRVENQVLSVAATSKRVIVFTFVDYCDSPPEVSLCGVSVHKVESMVKMLYIDKGDGNWLAQIFIARNEERRGIINNIWKFRGSFEIIQDRIKIAMKVCPFTWDQKCPIYQCKRPHCETAFYNYNQLRSHEEDHRKGFSCHRCVKRFDSKEALKQHKVTCYLLCKYCEKQFARPCQLEDHERLHTGEKPFKCQKCDEAFASNDALKSHEVRAHGAKELECSECGRKFHHVSDRNSHRWTHFPIKRWLCSECDKQFHKKFSGTRHLNDDHGGKGQVNENEEWTVFSQKLKDDEKEADATAGPSVPKSRKRKRE